MAVSITIGGVSKNIRRGSLSIAQTANGRSTASFTVESTDGTYRPAQDAEVVITNGATVEFAGLVERPKEKGLAGGKGIPAITTSVSAVDYHAYTERRFVNETLAAGSLKSMLTTLVTNYLDDYGVTLHGSQVDGPTLASVEYKYRRLDEVLNELATLTADAGEPFVWRIDNSKVLRMFQPSTSAAPFNLSGDTIAQVVGDIEVETTREHYANRIIVKVPSKTEVEHVESFTGDGSTTVFTVTDGWKILKPYGYVTHAGNFETLGPTGDTDGPTWEYNLTAGTITYMDGAPADAAAISFKFDGEYSGEGIAEDAGEIASVGIWERVVLVESVPVETTPQAIADGYLAKSIHPTHTIKYKTLEAGILPGQSQTVSVTRRNISATAVISEVRISEFDNDSLIRHVTAVIDDAQTNLGRGWRDVYTLWRGDLTGGQAAPVATSGGTTPIAAGPALPDKSNQFNDSNKFGGHASWTFDKTTTTVMIGTGHTPGGADNFLNGSDHTVN